MLIHVVNRGDVLWRIANRFSIPLRELMSINRIINPDLIYPRLTLLIPQERKPPIEVNGLLILIISMFGIPIFIQLFPMHKYT